MITRNKLPKSYKPYKRLDVCSNILLGGAYLVALGEVLPLLVGSGEAPMVWLQAPTEPNGKNYVLLVSASVSAHPAVAIVGGKEGLTVSLGTTIVLRVSQTDPDNAVIDLLDLRPIGLNIWGTASGLTAGDARLSGNTFSGGGSLIAFGNGR
jgi:hypothetical protein